MKTWLCHLQQSQQCVVPKGGSGLSGSPFTLRALSSEMTLTNKAPLPPPPEWRPTQAELELFQKSLRGQAQPGLPAQQRLTFESDSQPLSKTSVSYKESVILRPLCF